MEFMLKTINNTIDESINSEEMKDKSQILLSDNQIKIIECIKRRY